MMIPVQPSMADIEISKNLRAKIRSQSTFRLRTLFEIVNLLGRDMELWGMLGKTDPQSGVKTDDKLYGE